MIADIEIRLLPLTEQGYPVEIRVTTDTGEQQFPRRYAAAARPTLSSATNHTAPGEQLWQWFMADPNLRQDWARLSGQHPQRRLRLHLDAAAPELHTLPWEQLHDGHSHLAASDNTPFSRYLAGPWRPQPPITADPVRVLVAIANPDNLKKYELQPVDVAKEWSLMHAAAADPRFELIQLTAPITLARLETALRDGVHILHLVGHGQMTRNGENALLYLADENNQVQHVRDSEFVAMLTRLLGGVDTVATAHLRLVYLSSCQTASRNPADAFRGLAPQLVQAGITSVVAMQDLVSVVTAQAFARTFYEQLAQPGEVDAAANRARAHILTAKLPGAAIPVLFSRLRRNQLLYNPASSGDAPILLPVAEIITLIEGLRHPDQPTVWDGRIPYIGLAAFQESDAEFFFGRESLVDDMLERVQKASFIVVAGPSGSGKSSVARAGLFHALRDGRLEKSDSWLMVTMQPGGNPLEQLALAVERAVKSPGVGNHIRRVGLENRLALLEQMESRRGD